MSANGDTQKAIFLRPNGISAMMEQPMVAFAQEESDLRNVQIVESEYGIGVVFEGTCAYSDRVHLRIYKDGVMKHEWFGAAGDDPGNKYKDGALISSTMVQDGLGVYTASIIIDYKETGTSSAEVFSSNEFVYDNASAPALGNKSVQMSVTWDLNENRYKSKLTPGSEALDSNALVHEEYAYNGFVLWHGDSLNVNAESNGSIGYITYNDGNVYPEAGDALIPGIYERRVRLYPKNPNLNTMSDYAAISTLIVDENGNTTIVDGKYPWTGFYFEDNKDKYLQNGQWDSSFEGIVSTSYRGRTGQAYVKNGVKSSTSEPVVLNGKKYTLEEGWVVNVEDADTEPKNGIVNENDEYYYYVNDKIDTSYVGLAEYYGLWWYVANGKIDFTYSGFVLYNNVWWCVDGGRVAFEYTGLWSDPNVGWWYVENGAINFGYNGLIPYNGAWWCVAGGRVAFEYTGLWFDATVGWWYVENGAIDFGYCGLIPFNGAWWCVDGGRVVFDYTGLWFDPNVGWWYVENGIINFGYNGSVPFFGADYNVVDGRVVF